MKASAQKQMDRPLILASSGTSGIESPSGHVYTADEKHAALGRHSVHKLNVSADYLAGMGVLGGLAGAAVGGIARAVGDYSLNAVALAGAAGATLGVLGAFANAKPMTPLEHARYELDLAKADEAYLLENQLDKPGYRCCRRDVDVIWRMANRYQEPWQSLYLVWAGTFTHVYKSNQREFVEELHRVLAFEYGIDKKDIVNVASKMGYVTSLEAAKELPDFKRLFTRLQISAEYKEDLAILFFAYIRIFCQYIGDSQCPSVGELFQYLYKTKYSQYKTRLEQDKSRLEDDIRILSTINRQQPASDSTLSATGTNR